MRVVDAPGTGYRYSGGGYTLLQATIEQRTGLPFGKWAERDVLEPLGMRDSRFGPLPATGASVASGHDADGRPVPDYRYAELAAAGLTSTAADLGRFAAALLRDPDRLAAPQPATGGRYGLGVHLDRLDGHVLRVSHPGVNRGWYARLLAYPDRGWAAVVLTTATTAARSPTRSSTSSNGEPRAAWHGDGMRVSFVRTGERRYAIEADRGDGRLMHMPQAPGFDRRLPHDLVHFVVERHYGLAGGVFGQLAAGGDAGTFFTIPHRRRDAARRLSARLGALGREEMARSERLAGACMAAWHARRGDRWDFAETVAQPDAAEVSEAVLAELDEIATRWHAVQVGGRITLDWPAALALRPGSAARGRRPARDRALTKRR